MKKAAKIFCAWVLAGMLLFAFTACRAEDGAGKALDALMLALRSGAKEQVQIYYDMDTAMEKLVTEDKTELENAILETLKKMDYKVVASQKQDDNKVSMEVKLTTLDFTVVMDRFVEQVQQMVSDEEYRNRIGSMSKEEYQGLIAVQMISVLRQEDIPLAETTVQVTMEKENGKWKMQNGGAEFFDTVFANLAKAVNSLV